MMLSRWSVCVLMYACRLICVCVSRKSTRVYRFLCDAHVSVAATMCIRKMCEEGGAKSSKRRLAAKNQTNILPNWLSCLPVVSSCAHILFSNCFACFFRIC